MSGKAVSSSGEAHKTAASAADTERRKRPEVVRYKPGAFKQQEPEELLPGLRERFDQRAHGGGGPFRAVPGPYRGNSGRRGRGGGYRSNHTPDGEASFNRSSYHNHNRDTKTPDKSMKRKDSKHTYNQKEPPRNEELTRVSEKVHHASDGAIGKGNGGAGVEKNLNDDDRRKRPERAHYIAKKCGGEEPDNEVEHAPNQHQQHNTDTKSRRKKKNKNNNRGRDNKITGSTTQLNSDVSKSNPKLSSQDCSLKNESKSTNVDQRNDSKKDEAQHQGGRGYSRSKRLDKFSSEHQQENNNRKRVVDQEDRDVRDDISFQRPSNPQIGRGAARNNNSRGFGGNNNNSYNRRSMNIDSRDYAAGTGHPRERYGQESYEEYSTKSLPWRRRGGGNSSGMGRGSRRNSPNSKSWWRDSGGVGGGGGSRQSSPRRWSSRPASRASSPRSSRGNSPFRSRPQSRRSSFDQRRSPVFVKRSSPNHGRKRHQDTHTKFTMSRTPSPKFKNNNKRDSRDLEGWTRADIRRKEDNTPTAFPDRKPPTGRVKSAPTPVLQKVPDETRTKEEKNKVTRKESETLYSDWSQEIEEEEERSLSLEPPPLAAAPSPLAAAPSPLAAAPPRQQHPFVPIPPVSDASNTRGLLRLVPEQTSESSSPGSQSSNSWATMEQPRARFPVPGGLMMTAPPGQQQEQQHRYLFDPNNPSKPIMMEGEPSRRDRPGFPYQSPPGVSYRFPVNLPRFGSTPNMVPQVISAPVVGFHEGGGGGATAAQQSQARNQVVAGIQGPDWYDVFNQNIYAGKLDMNVIVRIINADKKLKQILQGGADIVCNRWEFQVRESRHEIMNAGWFLLKNELYFVCNKDVDGHIWKTVYHEVIEMLRDAYLNSENTDPEFKQNIKTCLLNLFDEGMDYYNQLLKDVSEIYHVNLERFYDVLEPRDLSKTGKLALIVAQKILIYLGDLSRYREQINGTTNYGRARQYYLKANHLDMRNGRPYNMLAILAKMSNRKFEAVYYNIRCLTSNNPIPASKEGLGVLFHEMKRRWEMNEKQRLDKKMEEEKLLEDSYLIKGSRVRREIWIRHEDGKRLHRTTSANAGSESSSSHEYDSLSIADLNKRFINTFLHIQGMFFTQINTEDISIASQSLLQQFRILVNKNPLPISSERLVHIMVLNMFSIEKTKMKSSEVSELPAYRSVTQTKALELAGDMFAILLERCNLLIASTDPMELMDARGARQEDLIPLLAAVKVWCDWLMGNNDSWCPVVSAEPFTQLAQLATRLEPLKYRVAQVLSQCLSDEAWTALPQSRRADYEIIRLTEDAILCDYEYWFRGLDWSTYRQFCPKSGDLTSAEFAKRVDQIRMCVEFMEGLDPPVLKWSVPDNSHVCLVTDRDESTEASVARDMAEANLTALIARNEDILEESYSEEEASGGDMDGDDFEEEQEVDKELEQVTDEVARLRLRKVELERLQTREAKRAQREILDQHVRTTLEIRPKFVLPDTNEFIDNLPLIKELADSGELQIRVSVVVLGELEGLSKSRDNSDRPEHAAMLRENSKQALAWIKEKHQNVKCVTTKGNILTSVMATSEMDTCADETNDDRILSCCLNMDTSPPAATKDGMKTVYRNSVLLTDDRNLKLKAHIEDCAVSRIKHFLLWYTNKL